MKPADDTSITLMMRVRRDPLDNIAWDEFVRRYRPMIEAWCLKWGSQSCDAEDISQEVLLKLVAAIRAFEYDPSRSFRSWLRIVAQNAWTDLVRARRHRAGEIRGDMDLLIDPVRALAELERKLDEDLEKEILEIAMRKVESRVKLVTWSAFQLAGIEDVPGAEAAARLGIPVAHVFVACHRVRKMLQDEVRKIEADMMKG